MDADRRENELRRRDALGRYRRWRSAKASRILRSAGVSAVAKRGGKRNRGSASAATRPHRPTDGPTVPRPRPVCLWVADCREPLVGGIDDTPGAVVEWPSSATPMPKPTPASGPGTAGAPSGRLLGAGVPAHGVSRDPRFPGDGCPARSDLHNDTYANQNGYNSDVNRASR